MQRNLNENKWEIRVASLVIFILYFLIILGSLNATESTTVVIGTSSIFLNLLISSVGLMTYIFQGKAFEKVQSVILVLIFILLIICLISIMNNKFEFKDLVNSIQMLTCLNLVLYISFINIRYSDIKALNILVVFFVLIHFFIWLALGMPNMFQSIYNNSNLVGPYMFYTSFFLVLGIKYSKYKILYISTLIISMLLMVSSDTRSILLSALVAIIVFIFWNFITKTKFISFIFFVLVIFGVLMFIFVYPLLPTFQFFMPLEQWMLTYTGKSIMSGRNELWVPLLELINQRPLVGYSPSTMADELFATDQSPHNLYLNILMQVGYLGLISVLLIFLAIWMTLINVKNDFIIKLSSSYFIGIIVHQSFEITLFQNQLSIGLLQLFIVAIGLSLSINYKNKIVY